MSEQSDYRATALSFLKHSLEQLASALDDRSRRQARFLSLATIACDTDEDELPRPTARTVVMRDWTSAPPVWQFHTDRRAAKVSERSLSHQLSAVFWDSSSQLQIRLLGTASECRDAAVVHKVWNDLGARGQQSFWRHEAPGTGLAHPTALTFAKTVEAAARGDESLVSPHFMLVDVAVSAVDCLSLADDPHHRVQGQWRQDGWEARWVAP
ncbi:hypothetical protein [Allohahella marinimesophila]|uniref:Pyridoxamine 5'-phosphate oxidase Alr4036 family FMN-binding domain-containing protein n=1 Tax=Allohahella marinimesophila TaxID=1054972 RepID=A0ABP7PPL2_9GAMM